MTETEQTEKRGDVIVGVDGSAGARAALLWAATEARLRGTRLRVLHAWTLTYPEVAGYGWGGSVEVLPHGGARDLRRAADALLEDAAAYVASRRLDVAMECEAVEGTPAEVLVEAAGEDDLLVVGSRGHGGFVGLLLGSVSQQCAHHARCPVVVVRAPREGVESGAAHAGSGAAA